MSIQELPPQNERIEIEGQNGIALRQLVPEDAQAYFNLIDYDRAHMSQFDDDTADKYKTMDDVRESIVNPKSLYRQRFGIWAGDKMVGSINLDPTRKRDGTEVGYWIGKEHTGHGYAAKALEAIIPFAFESRPDKGHLFAKVAIGNHASRKTLEKCGFKYSGPDDINWYFYLMRPDGINRLTP